VEKCTDTLYRLARFPAGVPPDALGAMVLFAIEHPELIAALFAVVLVVLKFVVGAIIGGIVTWYLGMIFAIHVWPMLPSSLRQLLRRLKEQVLLKPPGQDRADAQTDESAFSRNSKRHPHW
jgi:hypothetical protein